MPTAKARNLQHLSTLLPVPPFVVLQPGEVPPAALLASAPSFIIRGCINGEDLPGQMMAGQGMTLGPVAAHAVLSAIDRLFQESDAVECIFQVFVDAPSGVLICLSEELAVLEYARQPGGVTGGRLSPFVAVFPNDIPRYAALAAHLPLLFRAFGPCDVELLNPEDPVFVQVRPYTQTFTVDEELLRAKVALQELDGDRWVQNEFCADLLESPGVERALIALYCAELAKMATDLQVVIDAVSPSDFIRIGRQIFMRDRNLLPQFTDHRQIFEAGRWLQQEYQRITALLMTDEINDHDLMRAAIVFRTYYDLLERLPAWLGRGMRRKVLERRQQCRERLLAQVTPAALPAYITLSRRLQPVIEKDSQLLQWLNFGLASEAGIIIVPGDFDQGPWHRYMPGETHIAQPCFLVTHELYPDIYRLFPDIKGIICEGGGINSHLALLAREAGMPLWIQVSDVQRFVGER